METGWGLPSLYNSIKQQTLKASHGGWCKYGGDLTDRHNRIWDIIFNLASNACLAPVKEKSGLLPDKPQCRPADVFLPLFQAGRAAALDVVVTCPLQPRYSSSSDDPADVYADKVKHKLYDGGIVGVPIDFIFCLPSLLHG